MIRKAAVCLLLAVSLTLTTQAMELPRQDSTSTVASDTDLPLSPSQRVNKEILLTQQTVEKRRMLERDEEEAARAHADARDALRRAEASYSEVREVELRLVHEHRLAEKEAKRVQELARTILRGLREAQEPYLEGRCGPAYNERKEFWKKRELEGSILSQKDLYFLSLNTQVYEVALDEVEREATEAAAASLESQHASERALTAVQEAEEHVERMKRRREKALLRLVECEMEETLVGQTTRETVRSAFDVLFSLFPAEVESCSVL